MVIIRRVRFVFVIILLLTGCSLANDNTTPKVNKGSIDLSNWDFNDQGNIRLDGDWEFYWDQLIQTSSNIKINKRHTYMAVPERWKDYQINGETLTGQGVATYRLSLEFNSKDLYTEKAFYVPNILTAYNFWIDGKLVESKGRIGRDHQSNDPQYEYQIIEFEPTSSKIEVLIEVANFHDSRGGILNNILLGNEKFIDEYYNFRLAIDFFVVGGLMLMAVYHFAVYTMRREEPSSLFFGAFCFVFAIHTLFTGQLYFYELIPIDYWSLSVKIQYLVFYATPPLFLAFLKTLYPKETNKKVVKASFFGSLLFSIVTLVTVPLTFTNLLWYFQLITVASIIYCLYVFIKAIINKRIGAKLILSMFLIFVFTIINDIFYFNQHSIIHLELSPLGFLFFIGAHSYVLSLRYAKAFRAVEELTSEIETTQKEIIYTLGEITETRSQETGNHVKRVAEYSKLLAVKYGLPEREANMIRLASPMHDVGKVGIPDSILNKPGKLTEEEFAVMKNHTLIGYEMLKYSTRTIMMSAATIALTHHEKWNGTGYPNGLKGEEIPIIGRITAVADVFDALGSDRPYKNAWDLNDILAFFRQERGEHFDPRIIDILFDNIDQILEIRNRYCDRFIKLAQNETAVSLDEKS